MRMVDLIAKKRDGGEHSREEIEFIVQGLMNDAQDSPVKEYQVPAWLMAVCWRGMTMDETAHLTDVMANSGTVLDLSAIGKVVGDKHSTGGVGDKTTLVFVPLLAAAGIPMAKLSGRGLGHTGGTIDKLDAIPGFSTDLPVSKFIAQVKEIGAAIGGQTVELAPADGRLYALRDVTATVESIPLIAASVMSKKIAAGSNLIMLDVKCGAGAFMATEARACELASTMAEVGRRLGKPIMTTVTDMEQPLGFAVGHTLEVIEAIETLKGRGPADLVELTLELGATGLVKANLFADEQKAKAHLLKLIENGSALEKFRELIKAQGGNAEVIEKPELMPTAKLNREVKLEDIAGSGPVWVSQLNGRKVAEACKLMGAGRARKTDPINLAVGVVLQAKVGCKLNKGDTIATIYADSESQIEEALPCLKSAFAYAQAPVAIPKVIKAKIS